MANSAQGVNQAVGGPVMRRLDLTQRLVDLLDGDEAIIAGIGNTNFDLAATGPRPQNFPMMGSMGLAASIALGVALAQPRRRVFALEGDGSLLMNLGCLSTIATVAPENLTLVIWDNHAYQITGNQPTATAGATDIVAVARATGLEASWWARDEDDFVQLIQRARTGAGPFLIAARVDDAPGAGRPERDPVILKDRFMRGIGVRDS